MANETTQKILTGIWVFNETLPKGTAPIPDEAALGHSIQFNSNSITYNAIGNFTMIEASVALDRAGELYYGQNKVYNYQTGWTNEVYRTIDFGVDTQVITDDDLYAFITENATQQQNGGGWNYEL